MIFKSSQTFLYSFRDKSFIPMELEEIIDPFSALEREFERIKCLILDQSFLALIEIDLHIISNIYSSYLNKIDLSIKDQIHD